MNLLDNENYLNLATFRKDGTDVTTPVWFAMVNEKAYVMTMADSWKVKRLRNSSRSRVAACDIRGKVHSEWLQTDTRILEDQADQEMARKALRRKYKVQMLITDIFGRLTGRIRRRAYLEISAK